MNYIDGRWVPALDGRTRERRNPARPDTVVATVADSGADDVTAAVGAVRAGYHEWAARSPEERAAVLHRTAQLLADRADDLARELVAEEGKTLAEALGEARRVPANFHFYAGEALRTGGETIATAAGTLVYTVRRPVGVVAAITPWNFPLNIPSRKIGPALAAGNGVVFKPSEMTPLTGQRLVDALVEAGVPAGALALVQGGGAAGAALVADARVDAITFTGSTAVGTAIHRAAGTTQRVQLEMGGKNALVVLDDADLERAADLAVRGAFGLSGQACTGTSRLVVHEAVHDELVDKISKRADAMRVGDGQHEQSQVGPLIDERARDRVRRYVAGAIEQGAVLTTAPDDESAPGWFVRPAVLRGVGRDFAVAREEVFGPVLAVLEVGSMDEAIDVVNDTDYGLSAAIVTARTDLAMRFAARVDTGLVKINQPTTGNAMNAPFGGVKLSSTQTYKEQAGRTMMDFYTSERTVYLSS